jgi:hypothetical protein
VSRMTCKTGEWLKGPQVLSRETEGGQGRDVSAGGGKEWG